MFIPSLFLAAAIAGPVCTPNQLRDNPKVFIEYLTSTEACANLAAGYAIALVDVQAGLKTACPNRVIYRKYFELLIDWIKTHQGNWDEGTIINILRANEEIIPCKQPKERKM